MSLPAIGYFILRQNSVQRYLVQKASTKLSSVLGTNVTMKSIDIDIFSNIKISEFCILDLKKDTLLYTNKFIIRPSSFTLTSRFLELDKIILQNPKINLNIDSTRTINIQFIVNKLQSKDTTKAGGWHISFKNIRIENGNFTLKNYYHTQKDFGLNFTDLHLNPLNLTVSSLKNSSNGVEIKIKNIQTTDHSGFQLNSFSARLKINKHNMVFNNLKVKTPESLIDADQVGFGFSSFKDFSDKAIFTNVKYNLDFNLLDISSKDVSFLIPVFSKIPVKLRLSGTIKGFINDLKGRDIIIDYGDKTHIKTNFDIIGLPDIKTTFWHVNIKELITSPGDIESIKLPGLKNGRLNMPPNFDMIKFITYRGKFTGFTSDFVAYGKASSNLGSVESDLSFKPDTMHNFKFQGTLKLTRFQLGKFISNEKKIGEVSLNVQANGRIDATRNFYVNINGLVYNILFNSYNYQNIKVNGEMTNKTFDGSLSVNDPNISMDFSGNMNFTDTIPVFKFSANVKHANLYRLNFETKDTSASIAFQSTADFEGYRLDNIKGEINLMNSTIRKNNKQIEINNLLLFTQTVNDTNRIILRSSFADAEIWGIYNFKNLVPSVKHLANTYMPSVIKDTSQVRYYGNNFNFEVDFKDTRQLTDFLIPGLYISKDSKLKGSYNSYINEMTFNLKIPLLQHQAKKWYDVYFNGKTLQNGFSLLSGCRNLKLTNQLSLDNFTLLSNFANDSLNLALRWNNWDTVQYKGNINISGLFRRSESNKNLISLKLKPSEIVLKDTSWNLKSGIVNIDSSGIQVSQLKIMHNNQSINAAGKISKQNSGSLIVAFENINLENLKTIHTANKITLGGIINGKAEFSDLLTNPVFNVSLAIDSLSVNRETLGKTYVNAGWNNKDNNISIQAHSERGNLRTFELDGNYTIQSRNLDFSVNLNKLKMNVFEPFLSTIFSEIKGIASGKLKVTGTPNDPLINGEVKTQKASFMVNYLKTRYNFSHPVFIKNNTFEFDNVEVFDSKSNKAYVNGSIFFEKLKTLHVDINIEAKNFECLNTTEKDNTLFFGQGFASGTVAIKGIAPQIYIDVTATSNRNTAIYIPLTAKAELRESNFIRFVQKHQVANPFDQYEIDKVLNKQEYTINASNLNLNLNLKVTPEADLQIVFDQKIGDVIKGNGHGDLMMNMEGGIFNMYGVYTIEGGEYLFTLGNIINKKFRVQNGGTITWNGNPLDASVDINAVYKLKAPLYELLVSRGIDEDEYKKPIPIDCRLYISDKLMNPAIKTEIYLPNADQKARTNVDNALSNEEEKNKQIFSLLILNKFFTTPEEGMNNPQTPIGINDAGTTGIEFLSNQFSNWLSQISKDFDIGINYHPGDEITNREVELALSTQIWNDRVMLNGNVDVRGNKLNNETSTNNKKNNTATNIVGDFDMDVKITNNGKLRLKVFNRSNESYVEEKSPYTQGIGVFYKQEFNNLFKMIFTRKEKKLQPVNEDSAKDTIKQTKATSPVGFNNGLTEE